MLKQPLLMLCIISMISAVQCKNKDKIDNNKILENIESKSRSCMDRVIEIDDSLGMKRNNDCKKITLSETILRYTNDLSEIDFNNCPETFEEAFHLHQNAWVKMLPISDKYPEIRGEMHKLFDSLAISVDSSAFKLQLKEIWDTWEEIELAMK